MLASGGGCLGEPLDLMLARGHVDHAGLVPGGLDAAGAERRADCCEVLAAQPEERVDFVRPPRQPVLESVTQRSLYEAAVTTTRTPPTAVALEEHDALVRRRQEGRPETGEPAADDRQVAPGLALERRERLRRDWRVEPEDALLGIGQRAAQALRSQSSTSAACPSGGKTG